jgi:hypothetical protein
MTTYAPNFTPRYKLHYLAGGITHTIQVRPVRGDSFAATEALRNDIRGCYQAVVARVYNDFQFLSAEIALTDSDVFSPAAIPLGLVGHVADPALFSAVARCRGLTFTGRAPGSRARFTMFGVAYSTDGPTGIGGDGQVLPAEDAGITTIANTASAAFRSGGGFTAIFPARGTYKVNDHLLRLVRKGIIA